LTVTDDRERRQTGLTTRETIIIINAPCVGHKDDESQYIRINKLYNCDTDFISAVCSRVEQSAVTAESEYHE